MKMTINIILTVSYVGDLNVLLYPFLKIVFWNNVQGLYLYYTEQNLNLTHIF